MRESWENAQYHTKEELPTKEEIIENFRLGRIDEAYNKK